MKKPHIAAAFFLAAALALSLGLGQIITARASSTVTISGLSPQASVSAASAPYIFRVDAGQTYSGKIRGYCINFGKNFPGGSLDIKQGTSANLGGALAYALGKGYTDNNSAQTALALWYLTDSTWHDSAISATDHTVAQEIVANANAVNAGTSQNTSLLDATNSNQVQARIQDFHALDNQPASGHYYGEGTLVVTNTSSSALTLYMPYGTIAPAASADMQNMLLYATDPQQAAAATAAVPTATALPATDTPLPATATPVPQSTATSAPLLVANTPTTAPSSSTLPANSTMPTTGAGPNALPGLALILAALLLIAAGYRVRRSIA